MPALLGIALIVGLGLLVGSSTPRTRNRLSGQAPPRRRPAPQDPDVNELIRNDPIEALRRYGTPADAARLAEAGVDLGALGYRKP